MKELILGAVAYDPKVVTIWEGFKEFFAEHELPFDYVLYSNYESQVEAHFAGQIHVAWNSPLAWIESEMLAARRGRKAHAISMRDTDCDLTSVVLVPRSSNIASVGDLRGKRVGVGAADSPQATLIPLLVLAEQGLEPGRDFEVVRHDKLAGKHGDHIGGERDAVRAMAAGRIDAACIIDGNMLTFNRDGSLAPDSTRVLLSTGKYDHCNFTILDEETPEIARFNQLLLGMSYEDPKLRPLLDLEGLKAWKPGRVEGYALLERAVERFKYLEPWLSERG